MAALPDAGVVGDAATSALTTTSDLGVGGRTAASTVLSDPGAATVLAAPPRLRLPLRLGGWRPLTGQSDASTIQHCRIGVGVKRIVVKSPASPPTHARAAAKDTAATLVLRTRTRLQTRARSLVAIKKRYMRGRFSFETDLVRAKKFKKTRFKRKTRGVPVCLRSCAAARERVARENLSWADK